MTHQHTECEHQLGHCSDQCLERVHLEIILSKCCNAELKHATISNKNGGPDEIRTVCSACLNDFHS